MPEEEEEIIPHSSSNSIELYDGEVGIGFLVKYLEHQSKFPFAKVKVSIYHKSSVISNDNDEECIWETDFAQEGISQLGVYEWEQRTIFDNLSHVEDCYVVFEIFESKECRNVMNLSAKNSRPATGRTSVSNKSLQSGGHDDDLVPTLWTVQTPFKIDETTGKPLIAASITELTLYKYPIDFVHPVAFNEDSVISIQLFDPDTPPAVKDVILLNDLGSGLDPIQEASSRPWIRIENPINTSKIFEEGDGIDLYVDGARFLPDNTTITKLYAQLMYNDDGGECIKDGKPEQCFCVPSEYVFNPTYNFRHEYRKEKFNEGSLIIFRIDTVEKYTKKCQIVGYAGINLFNISSDDDVSYCLNEGSFQIPLHLSNPPYNSLTISNLLKKQRLPCATLLIRIIIAPRSEDGTTVLGMDNTPEDDWIKSGVMLPAPNYSDSVYDTTMCEPSVPELRLYNSLNTRSDILITTIVETVFEEEVKKDEDLCDDNEKFTEFCMIQLKPPPKSLQQFIDLSHFASYNHNMGISVSIDGINDLVSSNSDSLYIVIYTICPPNINGIYETEFKITDNIHFTYNWNWSSLTTSPRFIFDKFITFKDSDFENNKNAILLTDIREIKFKTDDGINISDLQILNYGFSFFPLFKEEKEREKEEEFEEEEEEKYVECGSFQNLIYRSYSNDKTMKDLLNNLIKIGAKKYIKNECALSKKELKSTTNKLLKPLSNYSSIFVRIYDNQRSSIIDESFTKIDNKLIPQSKREKSIYTGDPTNQQKKKKKKKSWGFFATKSQPLQSILTNSKINDQKAFIKKLIRMIAKKLEIDHYNF